jgi:hypothetical protein
MQIKKGEQRSATLTTADLHSKAFGGFKQNNKIKYITSVNLFLFQVKQTKLNKKATTSTTTTTTTTKATAVAVAVAVAVATATATATVVATKGVYYQL